MIKKPNQKNMLLILVTLLIVFGIMSILKTGVKEHKKTYLDYFDTVSEITIASKNEVPLKHCESFMKVINSELSAENSDSLLYKYNSGEKAEFSDDAKALIDFGADFSEENPDYFSIYLNPLIKAWDIKNNTGTIPDITQAMLEASEKKQINLGAVTKGYVTEKLVEILKKDGISSALINLGGNAYAMGKKITGENWKIAIQSPKDENDIIGIVTAENLAVITSGDYERFFELDNIRYHHILDPKTGFPANSGLHSVTVISDNPTLCDALSTAIFVAGLDEGKKLLKEYNCGGVLITDDTVYMSRSIENIFKQVDFSYKYEFID